MRDGCHAFGQAVEVAAPPRLQMRHRPLVPKPGSAEHSDPDSPPPEPPLLPSCNGALHTGSMIVQVLGCSGSIAAGCRTTSFLLDDDVLIDAGTGVGDLPLDALARIEHILISHSHLDHILSIGAARRQRDARARHRQRGPIQVHALPETLGGAAHAHLQRRHLARLHAPAERRAADARAACRSRSARCSSSNGKRVEVLDAVAHRSGGRLRGRRRHRRGWWVYTGDTGPNPALWERLRDDAASPTS